MTPPHGGTGHAFYPAFPLRESLFHADHSAAPEAPAPRSLDLGNAEDRALLQRVAAKAEPVTDLFGARDYRTTILWYWSNFYRNGLRYVPEHDAILVIDQTDDLLRIYDILSSAPLDLASYLLRVIKSPITQLEFGFTPTRYWPHAVPKADYTDAPLYARGPFKLPTEPSRYPMLAQT